MKLICFLDKRPVLHHERPNQPKDALKLGEVAYDNYFAMFIFRCIGLLRKELALYMAVFYFIAVIINFMSTS